MPYGKADAVCVGLFLSHNFLHRLHKRGAAGKTIISHHPNPKRR